MRECYLPQAFFTFERTEEISEILHRSWGGAGFLKSYFTTEVTPTPGAGTGDSASSDTPNETPPVTSEPTNTDPAFALPPNLRSSYTRARFVVDGALSRPADRGSSGSSELTFADGKGSNPDTESPQTLSSRFE